MTQKNLIVNLTPYEAASIAAYLKAFNHYSNGEAMKGVRESIESFLKQVNHQWTDDNRTEAKAETEINRALGFEP